MNKGIRFIACAALVGSAILTGCNKISGGEQGRIIRFFAVAEGPSTKAAYGNDDKGKQAINWETGDVIRITSPTAVVTNTTDKHEADYVVTVTKTGVPSEGTISHYDNNGNDATDDENGLAWGDDSSVAYAFYAIYPSTVVNSGITLSAAGAVSATLPASTTLSASSVKKYLKADGKVATQGADDPDLAYTYTVYEPDMKYAYMTAAASGDDVVFGEKIDLRFNPAFTAFEINLTSGDENFTVSKVELAGEGLSGTYSMTAGADLSAANAVSLGTVSNSVSATLPAATAPNVKTDTGVTLTLFTIPKTNTGTIYLKVYTSENGTTPATLALTNADKTAYEFLAGYKYRINLLKVGGRWKYKITIDPEELPWDRTDKETTYSQNVQATPFSIENAKETGNNYYPAGTKDYQVRTLDMGKDYGSTAGEPNKPYFLVTFKPMAPLGGYWMLIPESNGGMGTAAFKVEVWDTDSNEGSADLKGQIMNQTVTLHITSNVTDEQRTEDHAIIIKALFSTGVAFDENSTYSADSEIQDAHKDGSFSYWRFVIPAKVN